MDHEEAVALLLNDPWVAECTRNLVQTTIAQGKSVRMLCDRLDNPLVQLLFAETALKLWLKDHDNAPPCCPFALAAAINILLVREVDVLNATVN